MMCRQKRIVVLLGLFLSSLPGYSATPINLAKQPVSFLRSALSVSTATSAIQIKEATRNKDFNNTLHIRIKQSYRGYPVWGGDGVVHVPHVSNDRLALTNLLTPATKMNGSLYDNINLDLTKTPATIFNESNSKIAMQKAIAHYQKNSGAQSDVSNKQIHMIVYVDENKKAHWAYQIQFNAVKQAAGSMPAKPYYLMDAETFHIYKTWDDIKTEKLENVDSGGIGGNLKTGQLLYDNVSGHLANFIAQRDSATNTCFLQNDNVIVKDNRTEQLIQFDCNAPDAEHNNLFWNNLDDQANGGFSPDNDAIFAISQLNIMYKDWYGIAPIMENGKAVPVTVYTHVNMENAYWEGKDNSEWVIKLGDGASRMYPSTAVGVIAHELGHGFTEQHSNLVYSEQSGGLNESFSDMADQAAQYYALGVNNWMHDAEITKADGKALRYLDDPTKDCINGRIPGESCSIKHMDQYTQDTDVHYSSGIFNHVFYLIGTTQNWDAKKAFDVMLKANMDYWLPNTTFAEAACGVMNATRDYGYDVGSVVKAFDKVGVDTSSC